MILRFLLPFLLTLSGGSLLAGEFESFLKPLFAENCTRCHGEKKVKGKVNLQEIDSASEFLARPELIKELIEVIGSTDMPPEDEPQLKPQEQEKLLVVLRDLLRRSTAHAQEVQEPLRRLNRFQYNNALRDLFELKQNVFPLPEKMMTRHGNYLQGKGGQMPNTVQVSCDSLGETGGFKHVDAFPKDARAAHGFDNQANQLTLSPLLLESFLRLSVSILESPDFTPAKVGAWNRLFAERAADQDPRQEIRARLEPFLQQAFRGPVEPATLDRYTDYAVRKLGEGLSFSEAMKKVASAVLSSPLFLYRYPGSEADADYALASRLSFFLWGSVPDTELLTLAGKGTLSKPEVLKATIERMLADPRIERFLDSFPAQWMQLEILLGAAPDPKKYRLFNLDPNRPASLHMVLEPLLLFDAVFVENRPVMELIQPDFGYQSELLKTWYTSDLKAPKLEPEEIAAVNRKLEEDRKALEARGDAARQELTALVQPVRDRLLAARQEQAGPKKKPVDLKPIAAWDFNEDFKDAIGSLHLKAHGKVALEEGRAVFNKSWLESPKLSMDLKAKTLEAWVSLKQLGQRGGGVMTLQGPGDFFDSIVMGERRANEWISGSNGFSRTADFAGATPEQKAGELLHLVMVYREDGTTTLYRNGQPYGKAYRKRPATFPKGKSSVLFGLRHTPPGGNKHLAMSLNKALLYDRALSPGEVAEANAGQHRWVSDKEVMAALDPEQRRRKIQLQKDIRKFEVALNKLPKQKDAKKIAQEAQKRFDDGFRGALRARAFHRMPADDPRYGGIITTAATMTMTSAPKRTLPIARGAWMIEVILNDPPPPPPNDVPPLNEDSGPKNLTIREKFAKHREHPDCAGCHARIDPLGFALENFDITGRWRDRYENKREVDASGKLLRKYPFEGVVDFKQALMKEETRFAKAFTGHLLRFALARELQPADVLAIDEIVARAAKDDYRLRAIMREVVLSDCFRP